MGGGGRRVDKLWEKVRKLLKFNVNIDKCQISPLTLVEGNTSIAFLMALLTLFGTGLLLLV